MNKEQFISEALCLQPTAIEYYVSQHLASTYPDRALIEGDMGYFDVESYEEGHQCVLLKKAIVYNQMSTYWKTPEPAMMQWGQMGGQMGRVIMQNMGMVDVSQLAANSDSDEETMDRVKNAWLEVEWQGETLDVIIMNWCDGGACRNRHWIMAEREELARRFYAAVCKWNMEIRGEVLVFDNGHWHKDPHLFQDIKGVTFDSLILRGSLKQDIQDDIRQFFAARETYEEYGIPWKRGILFVGPAGNGKTHAVKALINSMEQPCLYVKSFRLPHGAPDDIAIRQVFDRARRSAPCVLVFEDLDAQVTPQNRSFFLNELDGFAANIGIVTLATTNHPERLDPAIVDRPSRFDRKYPFELPELAERRAYVKLWNSSLKPQLRLSEEGMEKMSEMTDTFSFAYLKELFLSSMMRWIVKPEGEGMEEIMVKQVGVLREQMASANALLAAQVPDEQAMLAGFGPMMARQMRMQG